LCCFFGDDFFFTAEDEAQGTGIFWNGQRPVIVVVLGFVRQIWPSSRETEAGIVLSVVHVHAF
jgi:hypothetical protein